MEGEENENVWKKQSCNNTYKGFVAYFQGLLGMLAFRVTPEVVTPCLGCLMRFGVHGV